MTTLQHNVHIRDLLGPVTLRVRGLHELKFRVWLAAKIIVLGAWVSGVRIEVVGPELGGRE